MNYQKELIRQTEDRIIQLRAIVDCDYRFSASQTQKMKNEEKLWNAKRRLDKLNLDLARMKDLTSS